ncbi:hypothetical protein LCGC14_1970910 [marine sediment metagenome]|uniref:Uncharacterized protein n=1 Tax=marine sediment metagenome TaxID=412755 RepID=A0A0F9HQ58_9ZZZZ|nr:hypothetical protein [Porticoccus sp.]
MTHVGGKRIIFSELILCPAEEEVDICIPPMEGNAEWNIKFTFSADEKSKEKVLPTISRQVEGDNWILNFTNWSSPSGATLE